MGIVSSLLVAQSRYVMSDSEFHSCLCGSEAGGGMEPGAIARGVMEPTAAAAPDIKV